MPALHRVLHTLCLTSPSPEVLLRASTTCLQDSVFWYANRYHGHCDSFHFRWEPAGGLYSVRFGPSGVELATCCLVAPSLWWSCHWQPSEDTMSRRKQITTESSAMLSWLRVDPVFAYSDVLWLKSLSRWSSVNPKGKGLTGKCSADSLAQTPKWKAERCWCCFRTTAIHIEWYCIPGACSII